MTALRKYQRLECGGLWRETPQDQRREVLVRFVVQRLREHGLKPEAVTTHQMVAATDCPGTSLQKWFETEGQAAIARVFAEVAP